MKPLDIIKHYSNSKLDLIADGILQTIYNMGEPKTTQEIVLKCHEDKVASHATVFHKMAVLKDMKLIANYRHHKDLDTRKKWIQITNKGTDYLNGWMK